MVNVTKWHTTETIFFCCRKFVVCVVKRNVRSEGKDRDMAWVKSF